MECLETAPVKIVVRPGLRVLAIYAEIDAKNGMPLHRLNADLHPRNRYVYDIVIIIQYSHYVLRITIPPRVGLPRRRASVIIYRIENVNVVGEIVRQEFFRAIRQCINQELHTIVFPEFVAIAFTDAGLKFRGMDIECQVKIFLVPQSVDGRMPRMASERLAFKRHCIRPTPFRKIAIKRDVHVGLECADRVLEVRRPYSRSDKNTSREQ